MSHWTGLDFHARQPVCEGWGAMMGDYLAHIRRDGSAEQTVAEHLRRAWEILWRSLPQELGFRQQRA